MRDFDVDPDEMPLLRRLEDESVMALFAEELEVALSGPPPAPRADLALLMAEGFPGEPDTAPRDGQSRPHGRRRLAAKLAALGLVTKVALGVGVAAAAVGGAGAAGVLPDPVQGVVANAVDSVTPFEFPDGAHPHPNFGATVSGDATGATDGTPGVDGKSIAEAAKAQAGGGGNEAGPGAGADGNGGATGLDRANQTPAAGHAPTSAPPSVPIGPGNAGSTGLDKANSTPAAGHAPTSVPVPTSVPPAGGNGRSGDTPAAERAPGRP